jgi:hypothetical protein
MRAARSPPRFEDSAYPIYVSSLRQLRTMAGELRAAEEQHDVAAKAREKVEATGRDAGAAAGALASGIATPTRSERPSHATEVSRMKTTIGSYKGS